MKSWKFSMARSVTIASLCELVLQTITSKKRACAIVTPQGEILDVRALTATDVATLPQAAILCNQYLRLKPGDLAIVNDPSVGGTRLSEVTLITAANMGGTEVLLASRLALTPRWGEKSNLSEEGVRIPPTPLAHGGQINRDLLTAISSHPLAPKDFASLIEAGAQEIFQAANDLSTVSLDKGSELSKETFGHYLRDSSRSFENLMHRLPLGTANVTTRIPSGETIKLHLEMTENKLLFDFKGTENSKTFAITELTTLSSCVWTVLSLLDEKIPITSALIGHFQVSAPSGTMLDQKGNLGTERGVSTLVPALCSLIVSAFAKLNPALKGAECAGGFARLLLESEGNSALLSAACGSRASSKEAGENGCAIWSFTQSDAEEKTGLFSWIMRGIHAGSGGGGKFSGGDGELLHFKILQPLKLRWDLGTSAVKSAGASQGKAGQPAQLTIVKSPSEEISLSEREGSIDLLPGQEVKLFGAGGGGYGEPVAVES